MVGLASWQLGKLRPLCLSPGVMCLARLPSAHRDPMAREQLFANLQRLVLVGSEDRRHRNALRQVSDYVE